MNELHLKGAFDGYNGTGDDPEAHDGRADARGRCGRGPAITTRCCAGTTTG